MSGSGAGSAARLALAGLLVNVALAAIKLVAGILGHSYALIADAIESMVDLGGSAVIWGGLHIASKPADQAHPYGHGRAESIAAMIVAMMVFVAGLGIGLRALEEIRDPGGAPEAYTLFVLIAVVVVKETMFRIGRRGSRRTGSTAVHVDAWHHRSDAISSLAALLGIAGAVYGRVGWADGAAAGVASVIIMLNGALLFRRPMVELMDTHPPEVIAMADRIARGIPGVVNTHKVGARKSGVRYFVDMHVRVDPDLTVRESHAIGHKVKDAIRAEMPEIADVLVHIEPG
jgi:cation diffusion facilitator family transporter